MKTKTEVKFVIEPKPEKIITTVQIDRDLYKRAKIKMKKNGVTLHKLVDTAMLHYLLQE